MQINLNLRQKQIISHLTKIGDLSAQEALAYFNSTGLTDVSRPTINRDLEELVTIEFLQKIGSGPGTRYRITARAKLLTTIDPKQYFALPPDNRQAATRFNWQIFELLEATEIFTETESAKLERIKQEFNHQKSQLSETVIQKEIERITIELSWKSSQIEGNTYSLLETENLLKNGTPAAGKSDAETQMLLNHKQAIEFIFSHADEFTSISLAQVEHIHALLAEKLTISRGIRKILVGITGTAYRPLDNEHQIREALERSIALINSTPNAFAKSLLATLLISYVQPFEDGNKRTSRIMGNAIMLAAEAFPLSFRSVDEVRYKEGMLLFYEQNNLSLFKQIFLEQAIFSVQNYFRSSISP